MMDENIFFKEATLAICSSLEIDVALGRCREYLERYLPADVITLNLYQPKSKSLRYLAKADRANAEKMKLDIKLSPQRINAIESGSRFKDDHLIINRTDEDLVGEIMTASLGLRQASIIALRLVIEGQRIGVADLFTFYEKGFTPEQGRLFALLKEPFAIALANAVKHQETIDLRDQLASDNKYLAQRLYASEFKEIVGSDQGLADVMVMVNQVAGLKNTVLLLGETGVGKEVIANAIHRASPRSSGPFIKVNCGAIPETLIDSELFGHEKGAFTGAIERKPGLFERAQNGTIFLDEIGELPSQAQVRLLRVLQFQEIERIGGTVPVPLDIRIIAATHQNLDSMVREGRFREDLFYRLNVFPIQIPPLRQRKEDIPLFTRHFIERKADELGIIPRSIDNVFDIQAMMEYNWPGNVRELENYVERALIQQRSGPALTRFTGTEPTNLSEDTKTEKSSETLPLDELISDHIQKTLELTNGRINGANGAAALLHVHPNTLRNKMNKLGISYGRNYRKSR